MVPPSAQDQDGPPLISRLVSQRVSRRTAEKAPALGKRPQPLDGRGSRQSGVGEAKHSALPALHHRVRAEHVLVALPTSRVLFICAKDLFVAAMA